MNEAETRAELIDPALRAAGWGVVEGSRVLREHAITAGRLEGQGRRAKAELADYVLVYRGRKVAVIEAKAKDRLLTEGVQQAKGYASKLCRRFAYATNGRGIYRIDMQPAQGAIAEGEVSAYPSPEDLWLVVDAEQSDLYDVLAYVAFTTAPVTREVRARRASGAIQRQYSSRKLAFLAFVLDQYVKVGVEELDDAKLSPLLKLKYRDAIQDAIADLGQVSEIRDLFVGFQQHLYQPFDAA